MRATTDEADAIARETRRLQRARAAVTRVAPLNGVLITRLAPLIAELTERGAAHVSFTCVAVPRKGPVALVRVAFPSARTSVRDYAVKFEQAASRAGLIATLVGGTTTRLIADPRMRFDAFGEQCATFSVKLTPATRQACNGLHGGRQRPRSRAVH